VPRTSLHRIEANHLHEALPHRSLNRTRRPRERKQLAVVWTYEHAHYGQPINFPSVQRGSERLRITRSQVHSPSAMCRFVECVDKALSELQLSRVRGFALDSRSQIPTGAVGRAASG
jgi:7-keto-8-aminopelargonate synthetase-like enzyme